MENMIGIESKTVKTMQDKTKVVLSLDVRASEGEYVTMFKLGT